MLHSALLGLMVSLPIALAGWLASLWKRDASLADRIWPWLITVPALAYAVAMPAADPTRRLAMLGLALAWALRLCVYISWRNWGHGEDRRYTEMRERHGAAFAWKSLVIVFGLQWVLGWIISAPLLAGLAGSRPFGAIDLLGAALALFGIAFEAVADAQMAAFRARHKGGNAVMDEGLWHYTRHPNYFGESCVWWGLALMTLEAAGASALWCFVSPVLITFMLLRVSGVTLLEKDLSARRPAYRDYVARTSAFIPWPPRGRAA